MERRRTASASEVGREGANAMAAVPARLVQTRHQTGRLDERAGHLHNCMQHAYLGQDVGGSS
jgi:hypothetical protein